MYSAPAGRSWTAAGFALGLLLMAGQVRAQESSPARAVPTNHAVLTGYGTIGYGYSTQGEHENAFTTRVNPIFLYQFQDRVLFESEFEFELSEGTTETGLEYGQVDFIASDNVTLVGGKMLLPFGVFGPRLHPTWVNLFPTMPPIFGHEETVFGEPTAPILADIGVMARGVVQAGQANLALNAYVTQGPQLEDMAGMAGAEPGVHFPAASEDNNTSKMIGGRLDIALPPWVEFNVSGLTGKYDTTNTLRYSAMDLAGELHARSFELRSEYVRNLQQVQQAGGTPSIIKQGLYAQAAYRVKAWQPVLRYTRMFATKELGAVVDEGKWQMGIGLDYWFSPSIAVMSGYEVNRETGTQVDNDRFVIHFAYGF